MFWNLMIPVYVIEE